MNRQADTGTNRTPVFGGGNVCRKKQERGIDSTPASEATVEADPLRSPRNQPTESIAGEALEFGFPGYGPEWRSSLELGRTRAQCPNPTIKRSGLTGIIIEETHDPAGCTRRGVAVYPDTWGRAYIDNARVGVHGYGDPRGRNRCYVQKTQESPCSGRHSMFYPVRWVVRNGPFEVRGRWSGGPAPGILRIWAVMGGVARHRREHTACMGVQENGSRTGGHGGPGTSACGGTKINPEHTRLTYGHPPSQRGAPPAK